MSHSAASLGSFDDTCARGATRVPGLAAVAVGLAALVIGVMPAAADPAEGEAETTAVAETESREADRRDAEDRGADAAGKAESAGRSDAAAEAESEVLVVREPVQECRTVRVTGSRLPRKVCESVARTEADKATVRAQEQRTEDYLRRRDDLSTRVPEDDGFVGGSPLGGLQ